ncbi:Gag-Pro-Pol polyprotein [Dictyocoela muelleri]|nr:Gag-Pro-Pol polyprotein [Dictyocoela muelleri]
MNLIQKKLFIITFTDRCNRFTKVKLSSKITSKDIERGFKEEWIITFKLPKSIISDNAKYYTSDSTKKYFQYLKIKQLHSSPFNPTGKSLSERINKSIGDI